MYKRTVLLVLDGIGITDKTAYNALYHANTPVLDRLIDDNKCVRGLSAGMAVGLPNGRSGNAMAGFENIGAGRIVYQQLTRIDKEIESGAFFDNEVLLETLSYCRRNDSNLHIIGMISGNGIHGHIDHLYALLKFAADNSFNKVYLHCITDGRDERPDTGLYAIELLQQKMRELSTGEIATVSGRYYAMDRDDNYDRVKLAYLAITQGEGNKAANAAEAVQNAYENGESDEFIKPTVIVNGGVPVGEVNDRDAVIFCNLRPDRSRELTRAFCEDEFRMFKRERRPDIRFVCFDDPDHLIGNKITAFPRQPVYNTFGEYLAYLGLRQLRLTGTENKANVTSFFDCGMNIESEGIERLFVKTAKGREIPGANAVTKAITDKLISAMNEGRYDFMLCDISSADIIGHTADMDAAVTACTEIDACTGRIIQAAYDNDLALFICSTHGKVEQLSDQETGKPYRCHTSYPVPFILINAGDDIKLREAGCLADIAPTLLEIMGIPCPKEMTGKTLINRQ
ncbi:MAG: 2,3-bisphosphoglycerate-independent phosphoglycerate mutase [Lachnospiraceae bacterium]|nr:2,3-bisphosphoglycerate-independent phosphoglycerate mutase [Lachnospiraceae bacterium]